MITIDPVELLVRVARATLGASERGGDNVGPYPERLWRQCGYTSATPWCACWLYDVGVAALGTAWPLPRTGSCQALYDYAKPRAMVHDTPKAGDVFLLWFPSHERFAHTGIVEALGLGTMHSTIEGNTNTDGSRDGFLVARRSRTFGPLDRFIRWSAP